MKASLTDRLREIHRMDLLYKHDDGHFLGISKVGKKYVYALLTHKNNKVYYTDDFTRYTNVNAILKEVRHLHNLDFKNAVREKGIHYAD